MCKSCLQERWWLAFKTCSWQFLLRSCNFCLQLRGAREVVLTFKVPFLFMLISKNWRCSDRKALETERGRKHTRKTALVFDLLIQLSVLWKKEIDLSFNANTAWMNFRSANANHTIARRVQVFFFSSKDTKIFSARWRLSAYILMTECCKALSFSGVLLSVCYCNCA